MNRKAVLILMALAAVLTVAAGGVSSAAKPSPSTTTTTTAPRLTFVIYPLGDYTSPASANITGSATCTDPTGTATLTFTNPDGTSYLIAGETRVVCDGQPHEWAATITSPSGSFAPGQAYLVQGTLVAGGRVLTRVDKVLLV